MKLIVHTLMFVLLPAALARGQQAPIRIAFDQGHVTLAATDALVSDVLAEWARVGGTFITGADHLAPAKVTLNLDAVDEASALEALIGSANALLVAERANAPAGSSRMVRVVITPPAASKSAPAREIDETIPESRFDYGTPIEVTVDDPDAIALRAQARGPLPKPTGPYVDPERLFDYGDPSASAPPITEEKSEEPAKKQPEKK
jgi:hypothetical protein